MDDLELYAMAYCAVLAAGERDDHIPDVEARCFVKRARAFEAERAAASLTAAVTELAYRVAEAGLRSETFSEGQGAVKPSGGAS